MVTATTRMSWHHGWTTSKVDIHAARVWLGDILESQFLAYLLHAGLDLLDVVNRVYAFTDDASYSRSCQLSIARTVQFRDDLHVKMRLPVLLRISNSLFQYVLGFFDELAVQIDGIPIYPSHGIVLAENIVRRLLVVLFHQLGMSFALLRKRMR